MPYFLDVVGNHFPSGQHRIDYKADFNLGVIPSWVKPNYAGNNVGSDYIMQSSASGPNEVQRFGTTGAPTGGTFTLTYDTQTTTPIAYNATAATIQAALVALSNIADGDVIVTGGPTGSAALNVTFAGLLAGTDVTLLTATSSLTGGSSPGVNITVVQEGATTGNIPHLLMVTSSSNARQATLTGPTFDSGITKRLRMDVSTWGGAWYVAGNARSVQMGFTDNVTAPPISEGVLYDQTHTNGDAGPIRAYHGSATAVQAKNTGRSWRGLTNYAQHSLVLDFIQKEIWLFNHDQMVFALPLGAQMPTGNLTPYIRLTTNEAKANSLRVFSFNVSAEY